MGLRDFIARVAGPAGAEGLGDEGVEWAFEALTVAGGDGARIVLVIDGAEVLLPETLRYIQLACAVQPRLQVVFSGRPEFEERLKDNEFSVLRGRVARTLVLSPLPDEEATGFIKHRLRAVGLPSGEMITGDALAALLRHGRGNPGRIAAVLDHALADQSGGQRGAAPSAAAGEHARAEGGAAHPDLPDATQATIPDERPAPPMRSTGRQRSRPPAWVFTWIALIAEVGLGTAILYPTAPAPDAVPVRQAQLAAASAPGPIGLSAEQGGASARQTLGDAAPGPEPAEPVRVPGAADPAPSRVGSGQTAVVAFGGPAAVPMGAAAPPPAREVGSGELGPAATPAAVSRPDGNSPDLVPARPTAAPDGVRAGRSTPPSLQPSMAGQLASSSSGFLNSASAGSRAAQRAYRKGGSARLARSVEHRWREWADQDHASSLPLSMPSPPTLVSTGRPASGYIGVYETGADGMRVFRASPEP